MTTIVIPEMIEAAADAIAQLYGVERDVNETGYRFIAKRALTAALAVAPDRWQPIAIAPKDGKTKFLGWGDGIMDVCWMENISSRARDPFWICRPVDWNFDWRDPPTFTHWRPLPEPPK